MADVDVVIVGGGPTGTTLALELAMRNISFRIVEKEPARSDKSRALAVQSRSLELLNRHGIAQGMVESGNSGLGINIYVNRKLAAELALDDLGNDSDTAFPFPIWISQAETERFLDQALFENYGRRVERPFNVEKIEQDDTGVTVHVRGGENGSEEERIRCKYVVGCDGAHSVVRHAANLAFEGESYHQDFMLADLHLDWAEYPGTRVAIFMAKGLLVCFPLKGGLVRLIASRPQGDETPTQEDFQKVFDSMAPSGTLARLHDPVWITHFKLHHRGVNKYREGRLFVAGDAAHIHSPAGGQGMNTGIQDAVNLGWKLASVLNGQQDSSLLDTYNVERYRIGQHVLKSTDRLFSFNTMENPVLNFLRNFLAPWVMPWVFGSRARRAKILRYMSQLGVRYRHSPIVGTASAYRGLLRGGDRAPDGKLEGPNGNTSMLGLFTGPGHHFIMFSGTGDAAAGDEELNRLADGFIKANGEWVKVQKIFTQQSQGRFGYLDETGELHVRYGFSEPGYVLVRPDLYLAHIGLLSSTDELLAWSKGYMTPSPV